MTHMGKLYTKHYGAHRFREPHTAKARRFISEAIRERQEEHPDESIRQSVAIAFSKARKKGLVKRYRPAHVD